MSVRADVCIHFKGGGVRRIGGDDGQLAFNCVGRQGREHQGYGGDGHFVSAHAR
jgi:hypothetical protein